ncbi:MAG: TlpA family protein disulfide reductase, partial [Acidobacteriota bacterium]|nr:TlpA family protein disulfide reductase [Acidobacteriota bacterium]
TEFEKRYTDRGFAVLGISMDDEGWPAVKPYLEAHNVNYRVVIGDDHVTGLFGGVDALPTTVVIDREGRIAGTHLGLVGKGEYAAEIDNLLAERRSAQNR